MKVLIVSVRLLKNEILKKYNIDTEVIYSDDPCPIVDFNGEQFKLVEQTINEIYPGIGVCPYVMTGGTDAKYYKEVSENCIRFAPLYIDKAQVPVFPNSSDCR